MDTTVVAETTAETLAVSDTTILNLPLLICIAIIAFVLVWGVYCTLSKQSGNLTKTISFWVTPAVALVAILFGGNDGYRVRIVIVAVLLAAYMICFWIFNAYNTWKHGKSNASNDVKKNDPPIEVILPINNPYTIEKRFVEDVPANVASVIHVSEEIRIHTNNFIASFSKQTDDAERDKELRAYFLGICYHLATLFDHTTRVHVRILKDGKYQKFISTYASQDGMLKPDVQSMRDMSYDNKMIAKSFEERCSLIMSLNPDLHEKGSRKEWKNYLMFALHQVKHNDKPVFSMGISVTRKINELFFFLNYCAIETIIGRYIESILEDKNCGLGDFIERFYFNST